MTPPGPAGPTRFSPTPAAEPTRSRVPEFRLTAPCVFALPEYLDMPAAAPLAEALLKLAGEPLSLDGAKVQRLGASCLQVLLAAARSWKAEGDALGLANPSDRFLEDLALLGLEPGTFLNGAMTP